MRRIAPFTLLTLALLVSATSAGAAHRDTKASSKLRCLPPHARAVAADSQAALYLAPEAPPALPEFLSVYGCSYKTKRSYRLGYVPPSVCTPGNCGGVELETLAGTMAAYEVSSGGPGASWLVVVRNLATGKVVHGVPSGTPAHPEPSRTEPGGTFTDLGIGPIESLVVKKDGAVAWIVDTSKENGDYQVHALDMTGERVLAVSPEIEPKSLALAGSTLYWTQGGVPESAALH
jgi:hypothetical protein